jgi:hypothetical protein
MSVLSHVDLRAEVQKGSVKFTPDLENNQWGEVSVDLRLGTQFTMFKTGFEDVTISVAKGLRSLGGLNIWNTKTLKEADELGQAETLKLKPGMFVSGPYTRKHNGSATPNCSYRRAKYLCQGRDEYASDRSLDPTWLDWTDCTGDHESWTSHDRIDSHGGQAMPVDLFRIENRGARNAGVRNKTYGSISTSGPSACSQAEIASWRVVHIPLGSARRANHGQAFAAASLPLRSPAASARP